MNFKPTPHLLVLLALVKRRMPVDLVRLLSLSLLLAASPAFAQSTAFTYNGRLNNNGVPVSGPHDMRFTLYDANAAGVVVAGPLSISPVDVANGLFTVRIDFGANIFTGPARWLHVEVRPVGGANYAVLTPRQEVTSSPYSIRAQTAGSVASGAVTAGQLNTAGVAPAAGQFLSYDGGSLTWAAPAVATGSIWSLLNGNAYYSAGNVAIGTNTPTPGIRLDVVGGTLLRPGNGNIQFGSPNAELGLSIIPTAGTSRADLRFDGSILKLIASTGVVPPSALNGIAITTGGYVGIGANSPSFKLDVFSDTSTAIVGRSTVVSGSGVYGESSQFNGVRGVAHNANHGAVVGVHDGGGIAVYGTGATGVQGDGGSVNGFGGYFRNTAGGIALGVQGMARVGVLQITGGADVAEPFKMSPGHIAKGSVVVIDEEHPGQLKLSDKSYDQRVAGIVSGANGVNPGISLQQEGVLEGGQNVSLSGRVYVLADATAGSIKPGDLLTTSSTPGHAMKVSDHGKAQGAILGKAMSALKDGKGMVLVLVTLQ